MRIGRLYVGALSALLLVSWVSAESHSADTSAPVVIGESQTVTRALPTRQFQVYGPNDKILTEALNYWNTLAGYPILQYVGISAPPESERFFGMVIVQYLELEGHAGVAMGSYGDTETVIGLDPDYTATYNVLAHEMGHALGFDDYNTGESGIGITDTTYHGIMSYNHVTRPTSSHDEGLLESVHY